MIAEKDLVEVDELLDTEVVVAEPPETRSTTNKEIKIVDKHAATLIVVDGENGDKESFWIDIVTRKGGPKITFFDQNHKRLETTESSVGDGSDWHTNDWYGFVVDGRYHVELKYSKIKVNENEVEEFASVVAHRLAGTNFA